MVWLYRYGHDYLERMEGFLFHAHQRCLKPKVVPVDHCSVCLDEFDVNKHFVIALGCGHHFHDTCGFRWLIPHGTCPECRAPVTTELSLETTESAELSDAAKRWRLDTKDNIREVSTRLWDTSAKN